MSRRKQAKPRAFLKLGEQSGENCEEELIEEADDEEDAEETATIEQQLLEPKKELFSDVGSSHDDENECHMPPQQQQQQQQGQEAQQEVGIEIDDPLEQQSSEQYESLVHSPKGKQEHLNNHNHLHVVQHAKQQKQQQQQQQQQTRIMVTITDNDDAADGCGDIGGDDVGGGGGGDSGCDDATGQNDLQKVHKNGIEFNGKLLPTPTATMKTSTTSTMNNNANGDNDNDNDVIKQFVEFTPKIELEPLIVYDSNNGNEHNNNNDDDHDDEDNDDDVDDVRDDDDLDDEYDDDDMQSLDSYYSDMYSTHTSSSYSPSISDGTITPNSLHQQLQHHHHHHQHLHHHNQQQHLQSVAAHQLHLQSLHSLHQHDDDGDATTQTHRLRRDDIRLNGSGDNGADDYDGNKDVATGDKKCEASDGGGANNLMKRQHGRHHPHRHHVEHAVKIPTKLRKIDKNGTEVKFDKMTGDGIKAVSADGSYQCQFCEKSFPRLGYLKKHEQSHAEHLPFKCDYCARLFKHKRSRDRHTKLHTGDRRYKCPHCEAAFSRSDHLKIHMKTHDNQKPFQCTICNRGYNTAAALTSHMQNHKKQAALLAAGGNPHQALNYSPRSTGSASSNGSLHKRRYAMASSIASDSSPSRMEYPKRLRTVANSFFTCSFCAKSDFTALDQLNSHLQSMHEKELAASAPDAPTTNTSDANGFQLACEYCTMKFPNIPTMFQHMRTAHIDRLTSPNSYFEHFNRMAASGTFSPRLVSAQSQNCNGTHEDNSIKVEPSTQSPATKMDAGATKEEQPTDLSQNKRRSQSPETPQPSPPTTAANEKPGVFFCNQCNAGLPDFESFRNHLKSHITQGLNLICHHCGMSVREQSEFEQHVISHFLITNSEYNCVGNCNKTYVKPEELQKHLLDQHVIPIYKCSLCSELFDSKVAIQVHFACSHSAETKLYRCSACMEIFRAESDFNHHVKTRHQAVNGGNQNASNSLQCMFCRAVCASDLEMHFHLAAHARQFRCPSCPETFHVEFLLDRHMQSQHGGNEPNSPCGGKESFEEHAPLVSNNAISPMANALYVNSFFGKAPMVPLASQNNNNNILDYNVAFAAHLNKGLFPPGKFYSPLQVDTSAMKHPALMYGLSQRYFDTNRTLMDLYAKHQQDKTVVGNYFLGSNSSAPPPPQAQQQADIPVRRMPNDGAASMTGLRCDICERNDFRTESEVNSHRKIVHNMKTGVSLQCAYCSGNFKSRSELEHHMKTCHNSTGKHKCLICDEVFPSPAILAEHKLQHSKVGQSGKCSHCAQPLNDVHAFKTHLSEHNTEGQMPVQCICCRQSLHSDFEIGLHAKFHTKSTNVQEVVCALCLEPIPNAIGEAKVCERCCRKHGLSNKFKNRETYEMRSIDLRHYVENRCNLCKMILPHANKLQEHLVEHTFAGCEDRGFICYICSAVFTAPSGLLNHMSEHGLNARPYDCNLCSEKFYFRAELDHHLLDHEVNNSNTEMQSDVNTTPKEDRPSVRAEVKDVKKRDLVLSEVKKEVLDVVDSKSNVGEDDEYIDIEVEKMPEANHHSIQPDYDETTRDPLEHPELRRSVAAIET